MMSIDSRLMAIEAEQRRLGRDLIDIKDMLALVHQILLRNDERMEKTAKHRQDPPTS